MSFARLSCLCLLAACAPAKWYGPVDTDTPARGEDTDVPDRGEDSWPDEPDTTRDTADGGGGTATLVGAKVSFAVHCCQAPPSARNRKTDVLTDTVGSGVEITAAELSAAGAVGADVDVSADRVVVTYGARATTATGSFNGYTLVFEGDGFERIAGASIASSSTAPASVTVQAADTALALDIAGITTRDGMTIVIDVELE